MDGRAGGLLALTQGPQQEHLGFQPAVSKTIYGSRGCTASPEVLAGKGKGQCLPQENHVLTFEGPEGCSTTQSQGTLTAESRLHYFQLLSSC